jgi:hypothetical protein
LASLLKITEVAQILGLLFSQVPVLYLILTKNGWATLWATFSKTHPVTLIACRRVASILCEQQRFQSRVSASSTTYGRQSIQKRLATEKMVEHFSYKTNASCCNGENIARMFFD